VSRRAAIAVIDSSVRCAFCPVPLMHHGSSSSQETEWVYSKPRNLNGVRIMGHFACVVNKYVECYVVGTGKLADIIAALRLWKRTSLRASNKWTSSGSNTHRRSCTSDALCCTTLTSSAVTWQTTSESQRNSLILSYIQACIQIHQNLTRHRPLWDVVTAGLPPCPVWCQGSLRYSSSEKTTGNTQNGGTVLPIANLMADSESGNPNSYSSS